VLLNLAVGQGLLQFGDTGRSYFRIAKLH
jgi:hypothetical protein